MAGRIGCSTFNFWQMFRNSPGGDREGRVVEEFLFHTFLSLGDGGVVRSTETCADLAQGKGGVAPAQDNRQRPRRMSMRHFVPQARDRPPRRRKGQAASAGGRARPRRSVAKTRDGWSGFRLVGLHPHPRGSAAGSTLSRLIYGSPRPPVPLFPSVSVVYMFLLRPAGSTPPRMRDSPPPPRGVPQSRDGTVCGAEPSNCTDGTFTRVDARFTGALDQFWVSALQALVFFGVGNLGLRRARLRPRLSCSRRWRSDDGIRGDERRGLGSRGRLGSRHRLGHTAQAGVRLQILTEAAGGVDPAGAVPPMDSKHRSTPRMTGMKFKSCRPHGIRIRRRDGPARIRLSEVIADDWTPDSKARRSQQAGVAQGELFCGLVSSIPSGCGFSVLHLGLAHPTSFDEMKSHVAAWRGS